MNGLKENYRLQIKKSTKSLYIISWNVADSFLWPFLVLTTSFRLCRNKINHWNDIWIFYAGMGMSNTLSKAKFLWNFPMSSERKINLRQKHFGPFLPLNCLKLSVGVLFRVRKSLERIRRMRIVTIYDFRKVELEPVKKAVLSPVKTFDWLFNIIYVFDQSQVNTDNCFWWCFQHNKDPKWMDSKKVIVYR